MKKDREVLSLLILSQLVNVDFGCLANYAESRILRGRVCALRAGNAFSRDREERRN